MVSLYFRNSRLHVIPTTLFAVHDELSVHLYMDASDHGLCVLDVGTKRFIILSWDTMELEWIRRLNAANSGSVTEPPRRIRGKRPRGASTDELLVDIDYHMFSIDVREHLSGALALLF